LRTNLLHCAAASKPALLFGRLIATLTPLYSSERDEDESTRSLSGVPGIDLPRQPHASSYPRFDKNRSGAKKERPLQPGG